MSALRGHVHQILIFCDTRPINVNEETSVSDVQTLHLYQIYRHYIEPDLGFNQNGEMMLEFSRKKNLSIINTWYKQPWRRSWTWESNTGNVFKRLDYVLMPPFVRQYTTNCRVYGSLDFCSDHRCLVVQMRTPMNKLARRRFRKEKVPKRIDYKQVMKNADLKGEFLKELKSKLFQKIQIKNDERNKNLIQSIDQSLHTLPKESKEDRPLWTSDSKFQQLLQNRTSAKNNHEKKAISKQIRRRATELKNSHFRQEAKKLNTFAKKREVEKLFRTAKRQSYSFQDLSVSCDPQKLHQHFKNHFTQPQNCTEPTEISNPPQEIISHLQELTKLQKINAEKPSLVELKKQILKLKNEKANIDCSAEILKICAEDDEVLNEIHALICNAWDGDIPSAWSHGRLECIWKKKGTRSDPKNFRPLAIGSMVGKLMILLIMARLGDWYKLQIDDAQMGFVSGKSTSEAVLRLKRCHQIYNRRQLALPIGLVDLSSAFDFVNRSWLWKSIRHRFPENHEGLKLIDLLEKMYDSTTNHIGRYPQLDFSVTRGVRQGGPESPQLYCLFGDYLMRSYLHRAKQDPRINHLNLDYKIPEYASNDGTEKHGKLSISWIGYADDTTVLDQSAEGLDAALQLLDKTFSDFGLLTNPSKTQTTLLNFTNCNKNLPFPKTFATINNEQIENTEHCKFLGSHAHENQPSTGDFEIAYRKQMAQQAFEANRKLFKNHRVSLKLRVQLMDSLVKSRLCYGVGNWSLTKAQKATLDAAWLKCLRKVIRNGWKRKDDPQNPFKLFYRNDDVYQITGSKPLSTFISKQQESFLAHCMRAPDESTTKQLLFNTNKYTKRGRHAPTLIENVLEDRGETLEEFCEKALDRQL